MTHGVMNFHMLGCTQIPSANKVIVARPPVDTNLNSDFLSRGNMFQDAQSDAEESDYTPVFCRALYDYISGDTSALSLKTGDIIQVLTKQPSGWWDGLLYESRGWFPSNYVEIISEEEADLAFSQMDVSTGFSDGGIGAFPTIQSGIAPSDNPADYRPSSLDELLISAQAQNNVHQSDFWIPDVASNGHIYYVNTETGLRSVDIPRDAEEENAETAVLGLRSARLDPSANLPFGPEEVSTPTIVIRERSNDDENVTPLPRVVRFTPSSVQIDRPSSFLPPPLSLPDHILTEVIYDPTIYDPGEQLDQQLTTAFHQAMEPQHSSANLIHDLSCVAQDAIRDVIDSIQSTMVTLNPKIDQIMDGLVYDVVLAVRNLLYIVTALPVDQIPSVSRKRGSRDTQRLSSFQPPKPYQRRVTAILSRLVLSVRALTYNSGSSLADTGYRIQNDAEELLRDVQKFILDIEPMGETRHLQKGIHMKRANGVFSAEDVDFGLPGGGAAASWKGFGYHQHDNNSIPLKGLNVEVVQEIELFVEQLQKRTSDLKDALRSTTLSSEYQVCSMVQALITRTSVFLSFVADIYVAQHVDISGRQKPTDSSGAAEYHSMVTEAAHLVRYMETIIQAIYDDSSSLLLVTQTLQQRVEDPTAAKREDTYELLGRLLFSLDKQFLLVKQTFVRLLTLGSLQAHTINDDPDRPNESTQWMEITTFSEIDVNKLDDQDVIDIEASFQRLNVRKYSFSGSDGSHPSPATGADSGLSESQSTITRSNVNDDARTVDQVVEVNEVIKTPRRPTPSTKLKKLLGDEYAEKIAADLRPWYLRPNYDPSDIIIDADNSVRGGTLSALVERLTAHDQADSTFTKAFLLTYNSYATLDQLFDLLVARFRIEQPEELTHSEKEEWVKLKQHVIRTRVINTMKAIVDSILGDQEDGHILGRMRRFLSSDEVSSSAAAKYLLVQIDRLITQGDAKTLINTNQEPPPIPISPKVHKKLQLLDIDPLELARQFTLVESQLYQRIKTMEALQRARVQKGEHDDNIAAVIQMSNQIAEWIAECILSKEDARGRARVVKHLIIVAERCRALNNFSTMSAIISGLNTPPIRRLKRTWEQVNRHHMGLFEGCEVVIDSTKTFTKYKSLVTSVVPPCIPFLGVFLSTLQFIQDGNPDYLSPGMINFRKFQMASEIIIEIKRWQTQSYNLQPLPTVIGYLNVSLNKFSGNARATSDYFWALSLAREPKEREDEKMARLLQESGF